MAQGTRRTGIAQIVHLAGRSVKAVADPEYRTLVRARSGLRALQRINPDVCYVGLRDQGGTTFVHVGDELLSPSVLATGHFQRTDFTAVWDLVQQLAPRAEPGVFVDVGANVGTTTLYAMRTGDFASAVALEPGPDNLDVLRLNLLANGFEERVTVVPAACGATTGSATLLLSSQSQADHRIARGTTGGPDHASSIAVATVRLDDALRDAGVEPGQVALAWVDTQGHEPDVLAGAADLIGAAAPFCIEFWPDQYDRAGALDSMIEQITDAFETFIDVRDPTLRPRPVRDLTQVAEDLAAQHNGQTDLVLVPSAAALRS